MTTGRFFFLDVRSLQATLDAAKSPWWITSFELWFEVRFSISLFLPTPFLLTLVYNYLRIILHIGWSRTRPG